MTTAPPVVFIPVYEFTAKQNAIIGHLASRMRVVGTGLLVIAALLAAGSVAVLEFGAVIWIAAAVLGCTGFWSWRASAELRRVVHTEGADILHLMRALSEVRKLYDLQYWVIVAAVLLAGVTVLVAITGARWLPAAW